ncbi:metallophosphoesterase family protein [Rubellimicrobium sp. CFH 75288]|uniref:metallophosphoesterase family protein n=1 Tax=Rubellimicrobium sp. CFH 75288 TaxID=2697034 RepID=UPI00144F7D25|nr:metallophosphoesterase family protein [Rubellimicrobium sp. CFH 75288]NAZ36252.1 YfcE family phosphodiesterase [Rubellimicrobium sp. CFH 75288]
MVDLGPGPLRLGLIADTHGLLRPEAVALLRGADAILHAGDVGEPSVLEGLRALAPVWAVRGNVERTGEAGALPGRVVLRGAGVTVGMVHREADLPDGAGWDVAVVGHSHRPEVGRRGAMLLVNPGAAGPRRFRLPVSVGWLLLRDGRAKAGVTELQVQAARR